jgi:hypothetical protein
VVVSYVAHNYVSSANGQLVGLQVHFINHFSGCQLCTQQNKNDDYKECESEMIKSYEYADTAMTRLLARKPPRNITFHLPVAECHYCQVCCWQL